MDKEQEKENGNVTLQDCLERINTAICLLDKLAKTVHKIGCQNFQIKEVLVAIADHAEDLHEDVGSALGKVVESSWF
jgi:hypothetical protein